MKLNILGSGGVTPIPRPTCFCKICEEAREKGLPYSRTTCSLFIYDINLLFDMGEDIKEQLNRERIQDVEHVILTHRHSDHTHGIRTLEQINRNFEESKPYKKPILVYISQEQRELFKKFSCGSFLDFYEKRGMIQLVDIKHKVPIFIKDYTIIPYYIEHTKGFYFLITQGNKHILYAMCEYHNLHIYEDIPNVDMFLVHNLFWENPEISPRKKAPKNEDSFEKMLTDADKLNTKNIVLTHIEESFKLSFDDINEKMKQHYPNYNIISSYDGMIIDL